MMDHNWGRDSRNQWNLPTWLANNSRNKPPLTQDSLVDNLPVTTTNTNITPVITDPFDAPFGNKLQNLKPPNTFCIALQNFGGWPQLNNHTKMTTSASAAWTSNLMYWPLQKITSHITWHRIPATNRLPKRTCGWWEACHINMAHNTKDPNANPYQPSGVAILSLNRSAHRVSSCRHDPGELGWLCWTTYRSRNNCILWVVAGYCPSSSNNGHLLVN